MSSPKIEYMPGTNIDAKALLGRALEGVSAGVIISVYVGIQYSDQTYEGCWSHQRLENLSMHARVCQHQADEAIFGGDHDQ